MRDEAAQTRVYSDDDLFAPSFFLPLGTSSYQQGPLCSSGDITENLRGHSDMRVSVSHRDLNSGKLLKIPQDRAAFRSPPKKTVGRRD